MICDDCNYYMWDEDDEMYYCTVNIDEDDLARIMESNFRQCPYFRHDDEYQIVKHQM